MDGLARSVVDAALAVHTALGPGLLEGVYQIFLSHELTQRGVPYERQVSLPIQYDGVKLDAGLRLDFLVGDEMSVELKAVETLLPLHKAEILTYLKLTGRRLGLLINFNAPQIKDGIKRVIL